MTRGRVVKSVINLQTGAHIPCAWDDCFKDGVTLHQVRRREGENVAQFVFCSERHRQYFLHAHRSLYNLPAGQRATL